MQINSIKGFSYFVTFIDEYSRFIVIYFFKHKSQVHKIFQNYKAYAKNQTWHFIKALCSDNGGELTFKEFNSFCTQHRIIHNLECLIYLDKMALINERKEC